MNWVCFYWDRPPLRCFKRKILQRQVKGCSAPQGSNLDQDCLFLALKGKVRRGIFPGCVLRAFLLPDVPQFPCGPGCRCSPPGALSSSCSRGCGMGVSALLFFQRHQSTSRAADPRAPALSWRSRLTELPPGDPQSPPRTGADPAASTAPIPLQRSLKMGLTELGPTSLFSS